MNFIISILLILLVMLQYNLWIGNGSLTEVHHMQQDRELQIRENERLVDRNRSLAAEVHDLKNGYDAIEERARSEMGMIRQDETFYQIMESHPEGKSGQE